MGHPLFFMKNTAISRMYAPRAMQLDQTKYGKTFTKHCKGSAI